MMNIYERPNMNILQFEDSYDVITSSVGDGTGGATDTEDEDEFLW